MFVFPSVVMTVVAATRMYRSLQCFASLSYTYDILLINFSPLTVVYVALVHQTQMMTKLGIVVAWCRNLKILPSYTFLLTGWSWRYTAHMRNIQCRK
jgi:hypothetical protein